MSVIGNITSSYDRSLQTAGPASSAADRPRSPSSGRRSHSTTRSIRSRRGSHGTRNEERPPLPSSDPEKDLEKVATSNDSSNDDDEAEVQKLARLYSTASPSGENENPFEASPGSTIDPTSDNFRARAWVKSMLRLQSQTENAVQGRSAGVSFRNLSVHGESRPTDYQKTFGNYVLEAVGLARRLLGHGPQRVDILRDFEGLVHAGEMLVVLGPPGSGCSTFLKTLSGETHGFEVGSSSNINYQGLCLDRYRSREDC